MLHAYTRRVGFGDRVRCRRHPISAIVLHRHNQRLLFTPLFFNVLLFLRFPLGELCSMLLFRLGMLFGQGPKHLVSYFAFWYAFGCTIPEHTIFGSRRLGGVVEHNGRIRLCAGVKDAIEIFKLGPKTEEILVQFDAIYKDFFLGGEDIIYI